MITTAKHTSGCGVCGFLIRPGQLVVAPGVSFSRHALCEPQIKIIGFCDSCPAPATQVARDVLRHQRDGREYFTLAAEQKRGCADHPVRGEILEASR